MRFIRLKRTWHEHERFRLVQLLQITVELPSGGEDIDHDPVGRILPSIGPKAQPFAQPRATPWGTGKRRFFPAQRANGSPRGKANFWPVGPTAQQHKK
jgi:hypothetical protein